MSFTRGWFDSWKSFENNLKIEFHSKMIRYRISRKNNSIIESYSKIIKPKFTRDFDHRLLIRKWLKNLIKLKIGFKIKFHSKMVRTSKKPFKNDSNLENDLIIEFCSNWISKLMMRIEFYSKLIWKSNFTRKLFKNRFWYFVSFWVNEVN